MVTRFLFASNSDCVAPSDTPPFELSIFTNIDSRRLFGVTRTSTPDQHPGLGWLFVFWFVYMPSVSLIRRLGLWRKRARNAKNAQVGILRMISNIRPPDHRTVTTSPLDHYQTSLQWRSLRPSGARSSTYWERGPGVDCCDGPAALFSRLSSPSFQLTHAKQGPQHSEDGAIAECSDRNNDNLHELE